MRPCVRSMIVVITVALCHYSYAHEQDSRVFKAENGLSITWKGLSSDVNTNQIDIYDKQARPLVSLNVLRLVPDARRVTIYDISAQGNLIAIAAVYESKEGNRTVRPTASMLLFNFQAKLLSLLALSPTHAISKLAIDDGSNIWTLTDGAGNDIDPSAVPMVVEYTSEGKIVRELFTRNAFPFHASDTKGSLTIGWPSMGYDSGVVWFWLPGSTELVTISTMDGKSTITKTKMPQRPGHRLWPLAVIRESSGNVVAQFGDDNNRGGYEAAYYRWSLSTGSWSPFKPGPCDGSRIIGISEKRQTYLVNDDTNAPNLCVF